LLDAKYAPSGVARAAAAGSLEHWLTERYCLYGWGGRRGLFRGDVQHGPWALYDVEARFAGGAAPRLIAAWGEVGAAPESAQYSPGVDVVAWRFERLKAGAGG
jgi:uncharacterized protein YqjF (DUF2071 family)